MSKIDEFKNFVKDNPSLIKHVKSNDMTWQKFYELWDLYGPKNDIWKNYREDVADGVTSDATLAGIMGALKGISMENVQKGVNGLQKAIDLFQQVVKKDEKKEVYEPRPLYRKFED